MTSIRASILLAAAALLGGCAAQPASTSGPEAAPAAAAPATDAAAADAASPEAKAEAAMDRAAFFVHHARLGECEEVKQELDAGMPVDTFDPLDQSALIAAASKNRLDCAKLLLERGAKVDLPDPAGWTPLIHAVYFGASTDMLTLLLDHGANINAQNDRGVTALYFAAGTGHVEHVQLLLARGADATIATKSGYTPLKIAQMKGIVPVVALLDPSQAPPASGVAAKKAH